MALKGDVFLAFETDGCKPTATTADNASDALRCDFTGRDSLTRMDVLTLGFLWFICHIGGMRNSHYDHGSLRTPAAGPDIDCPCRQSTCQCFCNTRRQYSNEMECRSQPMAWASSLQLQCSECSVLRWGTERSVIGLSSIWGVRCSRSRKL